MVDVKSHHLEIMYHVIVSIHHLVHRVEMGVEYVDEVVVVTEVEGEIFGAVVFEEVVEEVWDEEVAGLLDEKVFQHLDEKGIGSLHIPMSAIAVMYQAIGSKSVQMVMRIWPILLSQCAEQIDHLLLLHDVE